MDVIEPGKARVQHLESLFERRSLGGDSAAFRPRRMRVPPRQFHGLKRLGVFTRQPDVARELEYLDQMILTDRIETNPDVMLGKPVIRGTRIPVELITSETDRRRF